jgi:hypothetical protein
MPVQISASGARCTRTKGMDFKSSGCSSREREPVPFAMALLVSPAMSAWGQLLVTSWEAARRSADEARRPCAGAQGLRRKTTKPCEMRGAHGADAMGDPPGARACARFLISAIVAASSPERLTAKPLPTDVTLALAPFGMSGQ